MCHSRWWSSGFAFSFSPSPQDFCPEDGWGRPVGGQWDREWNDVICAFWSLLSGIKYSCSRYIMHAEFTICNLQFIRGMR